MDSTGALRATPNEAIPTAPLLLLSAPCHPSLDLLASASGLLLMPCPFHFPFSDACTPTNAPDAISRPNNAAPDMLSRPLKLARDLPSSLDTRGEGKCAGPESGRGGGKGFGEGGPGKGLRGSDVWGGGWGGAFNGKLVSVDLCEGESRDWRESGSIASWVGMGTEENT